MSEKKNRPRKAKIDPETEELTVLDESAEDIDVKVEKKSILDEYGMTDEQVEERLRLMEEEEAEEDARRLEIAKRAPLLTKVFLKGKDYREPELVKLKDGSFFKVLLKPVSDEDIYRAFDEVGIEEIPGPGKALDVPQIKFARLATRLAAIAIDMSVTKGITEQELIDSLAYGEATRIGTRIMTRLFTRVAIESDRSPDMAAESGSFH